MQSAGSSNVLSNGCSNENGYETLCFINISEKVTSGKS